MMNRILIGWLGLALVAGETAWAADPPSFSPLQVLTNGEVRLEIAASAGQMFRLESSLDLADWTGLATILGTAAPSQYTDSGAPYVPWRFYRTANPTTTNLVVGDLLPTADGEVTIHPINHATFVMTWKGMTIYCDPVGGAGRFNGLPRADLILVSHQHSDHFDAATINAVRGSNAVVLAPLGVFQALSTNLKAISTILTNGASTNIQGVAVEAVPAYNLTTSNHLKGVGNGYVLTIGGKRIYVSGDTEDIPELRALPEIDVAFLCMNLPFTMSVDKASDAVREFRPKIIYPYHYSQSDVNRFKRQVGQDLGIEVRLRKWY